MPPSSEMKSKPNKKLVLLISYVAFSLILTDFHQTMMLYLRAQISFKCIYIVMRRMASSQILRHLTKNQGLDIVEGSAPTETEKEMAHRAEASNVEAPATQDSPASTIGREREKTREKKRIRKA